MVGHGGSSAGSYLADPTSPIPSHCASIVASSTLRVEKDPLPLCPCCHVDSLIILTEFFVMNEEIKIAPEKNLTAYQDTRYKIQDILFVLLCVQLHTYKTIHI